VPRSSRFAQPRARRDPNYNILMPIPTFIDEDEEMAGQRVEARVPEAKAASARSSCAYRPVLLASGKRGRRRSVRTWPVLGPRRAGRRSV